MSSYSKDPVDKLRSLFWRKFGRYPNLTDQELHTIYISIKSSNFPSSINDLVPKMEAAEAVKEAELNK